MGRLFGTDGIRGEANRYPMDGATALAVGQAVAQLCRPQGRAPRIVIGRDTRLSGVMLESALVAGIASMGGDALTTSVMPTPGVAFLVRDLRADAGISISASHNSYQDNGIKVFSRDGFKLSGAQEEQLEDLVLGGDLPVLAVSPAALGRREALLDADGRYIVFLKHTFPRGLTLQGVRVALDCANGATYSIAPRVLSELGAEVVVLHNQPDGCNINRGCGSEHVGSLAEAVVAEGCTVGLAFDGDGDRLIAVDETGRRLTGDQTLLICALMLREHGRLPGDLVVSTVMSNGGFLATLRRHGLRHCASQVGDRNVLQEMLRTRAVLGGEDSGHTIFLEHHTTGDGIITGLQLLAAMLEAGKPLSELADVMQVYPQVLINVEVARRPDLTSVPEVQRAIARAERELGEEGRVLVRYSGTEDLCRVMVEAATQEQAECCCREVAQEVKTALG